MTGTAPAITLAEVRALKQATDQAEVDQLVGTQAWLEQHLVDPGTSDDLAHEGHGDGELLLAGDGAPAVSEAAVVELLTTLGLSDTAGRHLLGKMLELKYRLPWPWQRVLDLEVAVWRALRIADLTGSLPLDGAAFVDRELAAYAHSLSWAQLDCTVEKARVLYDPEEVQRRKDADPRHFDVHTARRHRRPRAGRRAPGRGRRVGPRRRDRSGRHPVRRTGQRGAPRGPPRQGGR